MNKSDLQLQKFITEMRNGISKPNRYRIAFNLPRGVNDKTANLESQVGKIQSNQGKYNSTGAVNIMCHTAVMPERMLQVYEQKQMIVPYRVPYTQTYNPVSCTFYADSTLNTRRYFEIWQNAVVNVHDNTLNFYSEFTSDIIIYALDSEGNETYGVKLIEAYPMSLSSVDLSYSNGNAQNITVSFSYKYWANIEDTRELNRTV